MDHMAQKSTQPEAFLPLPAATFHILMAVAEEDRHGYAIIQDVAARTGGELKLSAGTLYRSIQRMLEQGLVIETRNAPPPSSTMNAAVITASRRWGPRSPRRRPRGWPSWSNGRAPWGSRRGRPDVVL